MNINNLTKKELLAYETGLHLGDGCLFIDLNHGTYRVEFSGHSLNDRDFFKILIQIIKKLYNKKPKVYKKKGEKTIVLIINSKNVAKQKINLGLPIGNKLNLKKIPSWISNGLEIHFLRGLADTDFSISFKKNRKGLYCEPRIELFTNNKVIANFVYKELKKLGFKPAFEKTFRRDFREFRIRMYGKQMLNNWMNKIGFYNSKHLSKVYLFYKFGFCPPYLTTQQRLNLL